MASVSLAGWRQGAIRAAFAFVGILFAALLAVPLSRLFHPLLPHIGVSNPITAWAVAPIIGFAVASIPLKVVGHLVHRRADHHYRYHASELQLALFSRIVSRAGICIGLLNGAIYFILLSFFVFNISYWTTQATANPTDTTSQPAAIRLMNSLGDGLQSSGFSKTASGVGTLPPTFYKLADLTGLLMQNAQLGPRFAAYPGLTSLWHADFMQSIVMDSTVTNALAAGSPLTDIINAASMQALLANKDLSRAVTETVTTNLDDLMTYLNTGKSPKYGGEPIIGSWEFNPNVTLAWFRQENPKVNANEMRATRALWTEAYGPTTLLMTGDNQIYVKGLPKFGPPAQANQPPFQGEDWKGDWSRDGTNYTLHIALNGQDKYLSGATDGLRLRIKDGPKMLVFDHAD